MKMIPEAFHTWCQHLGLTSETEALLASIRSSSPVRRVNSRVGNITGRFPSPKMGVSIQFESAHVEFWAIYTLECDPDILEYYDQPRRIPLTYLAKSGKRTTQWHTPDFFVLRSKSAGWEEWKPAQALEPLASSQPARYQVAGTGHWHCPPGETYAAHLGLTYQLRSSAEFHPLEIQNLKFLQDFWAHEVPAHPEQESLALAHIQAHPGTALSDLLATYPELAIDIIWVLLSTGRAFTDLSATLLIHHEQVVLYAEEGQVRAAPAFGSSAISTVTPEAPVAWDGRLWTFEGWGEMVHLWPELGETFAMPRVEFDRLKQEGELWVAGAAAPSPMTEVVRQAISQTSHNAQQRANHRMTQMLAYARGEPTTASRRSVQRWWKAFQEAKDTHGSGYLGLLDRVAARGNRTKRTDSASWEELETALQNHYAAPQGKNAAAVYRLYCGQCEKRGIPPLSQQTFYRARARFTTTKVITRRHGSRAAYAAGPFCWLDQTTPRHGDRPFALAHLDHTPLDIVLVSSLTGKPLGKPWATFLTDAYSRRILACYLTYDPPGYRSVMMAMRICVQRHQRLPQECFVDRGPEFGSVYFETLLTRYFVTKLDRPSGQPRMGSVIERLFGTAGMQFLHQLSGNTQASQHSRQMTREVDPRRLAVWTLERFAARFCQYAYEIYDQMDHAALGQSPREAFHQGIQLAGMRTHRLIPYSEEFLMLTCPTTRTRSVKLDAARGIVVNGLRYYHPLMRSAKDAGKQVEVRYEPFNMGIAYVFVDGQWLTCTVVGNVAHLMAMSKATRSKLGAADWLKMRLTAEQALTRARVRSVFVDEGHRLMQGDGIRSVDEQLEWLKSLSNRTHVLHVLAGPYALFEFRNTSGQLARRGRDIHFARYHVEDKEERIAFMTAVKYLLERVPLTVDLQALLPRWRWWAEGCVGCVGILRDWLVDAVAATLVQKGTSLTEDILTKTMPHSARRLSLEIETRAGERQVALHESESVKQFQALVKRTVKPGNGKTAQMSGAQPELLPTTQREQETVSGGSPPPMPQVTPKPTNQRVGQRAPERDPVGETSAFSVRESTRCSFAEVITVTSSQMIEHGVSHFECPTCLAVREIKPRGGRVKFPSHPKRLTTTPNQGARWVKRESTWKPFDS